MSYLGEHLYSCSAVPFDWSQVEVVVVSGVVVNPCGHAIVRAGICYFHVDGRKKLPW